MILRDSTYCRIKTEDVFKGKPGEPIVEGATFGWITHGGDRVTRGESHKGRELAVGPAQLVV